MNSGYSCLEFEGGDRGTIQLGQSALLNDFYVFQKSFTLGNDYRQITRKAFMTIIHTFPKSIKEDMILHKVSRLHHSGGFLNKTLVEIKNMSGHNSERAHSLLSCISKIGKDESIIELDEKEQESSCNFSSHAFLVTTIKFSTILDVIFSITNKSISVTIYLKHETKSKIKMSCPVYLFEYLNISLINNS